MRDHYDTLTLKLQDSLDTYEKYSENPSELPFLAQFVRVTVADNRAASFDSSGLDTPQVCV